MSEGTEINSTEKQKTKKFVFAEVKPRLLKESESFFIKTTTTTTTPPSTVFTTRQLRTYFFVVLK